MSAFHPKLTGSSRPIADIHAKPIIGSMSTLVKQKPVENPE
jgi:hypothetical protein